MWTDYRAAHLAERRGTFMLLHSDARRHYRRDSQRKANAIGDVAISCCFQ